MSNGSNMTYEQAQEQAVKLHKQGMTYPKIEEHFKSIGYKSARTKAPIGALAIRHMVTTVDKKSKDEDKKFAKEEENEMKLARPGFRDTVRKLAEVPGLDEDTFISLMKALIAQQDRQSRPRANS